MSARLQSLLTQSRRPRILVVGDAMLDRYLWGDVDRVSPEAPIPVIRVGRQEHRLGGAANVAAMLAALNARAQIAAIVGDDPEGSTLRGLLKDCGVASKALIRAADRATTVKERLLGRSQCRHPQQMIRVDREDTRPVGAAAVNRLLEAIWPELDRLDLILLSDYGKGVCAGALVPQLIAIAQAADVPVLADPARSADYHKYAGCACVTPNRHEAGLAAGMRIVTPEDGLEAARRLLAFGVKSAAVTLDREGIAWADCRDGGRVVPTRPRQVYDITGAGDMVMAALGYAIASGADWPDALELANLAGGLEVEKLGVVPIRREELLAEIATAPRGPCLGSPSRGKTLPLDQLLAELDRRRGQGHRVVMTNGCFDLLHPGHVASLEHARSCGDLLVVAVNSDRSVRELKGPGRPILDEQGRAAMLAALACVDYVTLFDSASVAPLVERLRPDVLVKAAQYGLEDVVGHETVEACGGRVVLAPLQGDYSTTGLIARASEAADEAALRRAG